MSDTDALRHEIEREHKAIAKTLRRMEETEDPMALRPFLEELRPLLETHFEREEAADGLHAAIGETAPNLLPQVDELFQEHREIASDLERLCGHSERIARLATEVREGTLELIQRLRDHEAQENDIFGHAVYDVHGAGD